MFEKADAEYAELSQKKQILHMDKDKIQKVIGELDEKKREALHASWVKVNQDFGSIFTSLLPGTMAKLDPPEGHTFLAGLEVKVLAGPFLLSPTAFCPLLLAPHSGPQCVWPPGASPLMLAAPCGCLLWLSPKCLQTPYAVP